VAQKTRGLQVFSSQTRFLHPLLLVLLGLYGTGCARHFVTVDFKYGSDAHVAPKDRFVSVPAAPAAVSEMVAEFIAQRGGAIEQTEGNLPFRIETVDQGEAAWKATREVMEKEWAAFRANDASAYNEIVRTAPLLSAPQVVQRNEMNTGGSWVSASLAQRMGSRRKSVIVPFGAVTWREREELKTRLHVFVWPAADGGTLVYVRGIPFLPKYRVEAAPGNTVAYDLWENTTGAAEARIVLDLLEHISTHASGSERAAAGQVRVGH
jgi:hypothetical protein